jgi:hypothetical protein
MCVLKLAKPCPTDHGGPRLPTAMVAMVPHFRRCRIRQSANILGNCCLHQRLEWGTMAAAVGYLGHNASTDIVGWLWFVIYIGICQVLYQEIGDRHPSDEVTTSILVGSGATGAATSMPNWPLCNVVLAATSLENDVWWLWRQNRRNKTRRQVFLHDGTLRFDQLWRMPLS